MKKIIAITGTRSDYGLMRPVYQGIAESKLLQLELVVTGMHLLPEFESSLAAVVEDAYARLHRVDMALGEDSGRSMARSLGLAVCGIASVFDAEKPDVALLQGDRGEMLAGAIAAAHMNVPIVHMSGGDYSGSIDEPIRNAITQFAHIHLTTCRSSTERLIAKGESANRVFEVGEPGLDAIRTMQFVPPDALAKELDLDLGKPVVLATQHPVTTEAAQAPWQMQQVLQALEEIGLQTVMTYPNSDAGGREMTKLLESYRGRKFLRIMPNLGSQKYLSLMQVAAVMVGNSSSGIFESSSFKLPAVNIGTRQHGRLRALNVVDCDYTKESIVSAIRFALEDRHFRANLENCVNPYGDGHAAPRTVSILERLKPTASLVAKWISCDADFLA